MYCIILRSSALVGLCNACVRSLGALLLPLLLLLLLRLLLLLLLRLLLIRSFSGSSVYGLWPPPRQCCGCVLGRTARIAALRLLTVGSRGNA